MMKEKIIRAATILYTRYGIKSVSMDRVSKEINISKKTIYEHFEGKEQLLNESVEFMLLQLTEIIDKAQSEAKSPVEKVLACSNSLLGYFGSFCPSFAKEIRHYTDAYRQLKKKQDDIRQQCIHYLETGQKEGYILPEKDLQFVSNTYCYIFEMIHETAENIYPEYVSEFISDSLRGICTQKGQAALRQYCNLYAFPITNQKYSYQR